jgi:hypothetical protein
MKAAFSSRPLPLSEGGLARTATTSSTKLGRQAAQRWGSIVTLLLPATILYVLFVFQLLPLEWTRSARHIRRLRQLRARAQ